MKYLSAAAILFSAALLQADVTIRYESDLKAMPALQSVMEKVMKAQTAGTAVMLRMKGDKAYTSSGKLVEIFDFTKQEVTVIDPEQKAFTSLPVSKLAGAMAEVMPQPRAGQTDGISKLLASLKVNTESHLTGQTATIQGVQAEEREVTITLDMPVSGKEQSAPGMKIVANIWNAKSSEVLNNPAIRELTGYNNWQKQVLNPAAMFEQFTTRMPALATLIKPVIEELQKNQTVILRMHTALYTPMAAMIAQRAAAGNQAAAPVDPSAPLIEVNQEVTQLSSDPVDGSLFAIPKDYAAMEPDTLFGKMSHSQLAGQQ